MVERPDRHCGDDLVETRSLTNWCDLAKHYIAHTPYCSNEIIAVHVVVENINPTFDFQIPLSIQRFVLLAVVWLQFIISSPLTRHVVCLLPFSSYLAGSKSVSARPSVHPSDPDAMTNTAQEAIASSSGKTVCPTKLMVKDRIASGWAVVRRIIVPRIIIDINDATDRQ